MLKKAVVVGILASSSLCAKDVIELERECRILPAHERQFSFRLQDAETRQVRLHLEARFDWETLFGYTQGMRITVNGQPVTGNRLLNKPLAYKTRSGGGNTWSRVDSNAYMVMYSPDFSDKIQTDESFRYGLYEKDQEPYRFVLDLSGLTQHVGSNEIRIQGIFAPLILRNVKIEIDADRQPRINDPSQLVKPAPEGPVPDYQIKAPIAVKPKIELLPDDKLQLSVNGISYPISSRFSLPEGAWQEDTAGAEVVRMLPDGKACRIIWNAGDYRIERRMRIEGDHLKIHDTFTNLRETIVGVAFENSLQLPEKPDNILRGGLEIMLSEVRSPAHPTIVAKTSLATVGMAAEDDILRNQAYFRISDNAIILGNRNLGLPPRQSYTLEWSIYILPEGDYYDFVNTVRRNWNCNFTMNGVLDFPYKGSEWQRWVKKELKAADVASFLAERPVRMLMTHLAHDVTVAPKDATPKKPYAGHGTAIPGFTWWVDMTRNMAKIFKQTAPEIPIYAYMHKNLCSEYGHKDKYQDSEAIDDESRALVAKSGISGRYVPTPNNSYGKALAKVYRFMVDEFDSNIYMDEICLSVTEWAPYKEWDNCTVALDPETHAVKHTLSIPNLLTKPWLEEMIEFLQSRGKELMANGPPVTRTLLNHQYPHFIEHGMGTAGLIAAHLATPLGWSYDRGVKGFEHFRDNLDYGALVMTWSGPWTLKTFPYTPLEIRPGYVIGKERIVTRLSGVFGWRDNSDAEIFVYDGQGELVEKPQVRKMTKSGVNQFEIRMPSDHVAILVRRHSID